MPGKRGRPSLYRPILKRIAEIAGSEWHVVRRGHANRTAPSALRVRYPEYDFRAIPDGHGQYTIEARVLDPLSTVSGREDER